jgi:predicted transcriptional regulator
VSRRGRESGAWFRHKTHRLKGRLPCIVAEYGVFFCIMSSPRVVTFRIAPEKVAELDTIAKAMDRDRSYLLNEAVEAYLSEQRRFIAMVEEGLEASRKGELIEDEEVGRMIDSWVRERATPDKEVRERA